MLCFLFFSTINKSSAYAQASDEQEYTIELNTIQIRDEDEKNENKKSQPVSKPQTASLIPSEKQNLFEEQGYVFISETNEQSGLQLSLSRSFVSFGKVQPDHIQEESMDISIRSDVPRPYQMYTEQTTLFKTKQNEFIITTRCDSEEHPCTISEAQSWTKEDTYGFGYNLQGETIPYDFQNNTYFRIFPNVAKQEEPQIISTGISTHIPMITHMTLKLSLPPKQKESTYTSYIHFIVIPE